MNVNAVFPNEMLDVPFQFENQNGKKYNMDFKAGFIGLTQDNNDYTLRPEIAWIIVNKTHSHNYALKQMDERTKNINLKDIDEIPTELYKFNSFNILSIDFINEIKIPDRLAKIPIQILDISGKIEKPEEEKIRALFPRTIVVINGDNGIQN